jgi:protein ImuA
MNFGFGFSVGGAAATRAFLGLVGAGTVHEVRAPEGTAGHLALAAKLLAQSGDTPVVWVSTRPAVYPAGLAWLGLDPARCLFAEARDDAESFGTLEAALRGGMAGVAESVACTRLAARRLALAARQGGSVGFLLRHAPRQTALDSSAFATRWLVSPAPGGRLLAEILYAKGGQPAAFFIDMEAEHGTAPALDLVAGAAGWRRAG